MSRATHRKRVQNTCNWYNMGFSVLFHFEPGNREHLYNIVTVQYDTSCLLVMHVYSVFFKCRHFEGLRYKILCTSCSRQSGVIWDIGGGYGLTSKHVELSPSVYNNNNIAAQPHIIIITSAAVVGRLTDASVFESRSNRSHYISNNVMTNNYCLYLQYYTMKYT